jgi:hypothetical protein
LDRLGGNTKLVFTDLGGAMAACRATLQRAHAAQPCPLPPWNTDEKDGVQLTAPLLCGT